MKRLTVVLALAFVAGLLVLDGAPARAEIDFTFFGAGWGHGIGMSQYGALGLAEDGVTAEQIIRHYYTGTKVEERNPPANLFRIGLLQDRGSVTLEAQTGTFDLVVGSETIESVAQGQSRTVEVTQNRQFRILRPNGTEVATAGSASQPLEARRQTDAVIRVTEWGHPIGRGDLEFVVAAPGKGHLVARVDPEEYLYGISEVPSSWPEAALEAQAIAARTYAYRKVASAPNQESCSCGLYASTRDQAFTGLDKETATQGERWVAAVDATARKVATYQGEFIPTFYSSSSGGYTENIENVWTGATAAPYLTGVCDPGDFVASNPNRLWTETVSAAEAADRLGNPQGMQEVVRINVLERGVSGRVVEATIVGKAGDGSEVTITDDGWTLRGSLELNDSRWWVNQDRRVKGKIRTAYDDLSCAPGLSTSRERKIPGGAFQEFETGRMYLHTAEDAVTWLRGPVLAKYLDEGGHGKFLGLPRSLSAILKGRQAVFDGGEIYWKKATGAHEVHGRVLEAYLGAEGVRGDLGFPTTDVVKVKAGVIRSTFEGGKITCGTGGGCRVRKT